MRWVPGLRPLAMLRRLAAMLGALATLVPTAATARAPGPRGLGVVSGVWGSATLSRAEHALVKLLLGGEAVVTVRELSRVELVEDGARAVVADVARLARPPRVQTIFYVRTGRIEVIDRARPRMTPVAVSAGEFIAIVDASVDPVRAIPPARATALMAGLTPGAPQHTDPPDAARDVAIEHGRAGLGSATVGGVPRVDPTFPDRAYTVPPRCRRHAARLRAPRPEHTPSRERGRASAARRGARRPLAQVAHELANLVRGQMVSEGGHAGLPQGGAALLDQREEVLVG